MGAAALGVILPWITGPTSSKARAYLADWAGEWDYRLDSREPARLMLERPQSLVHLHLLQQSLADLLQADGAGEDGLQPDVIIAHAFLDLVDLPTVLPGLIGLLRPGGYLYLTHNFDGETIFEPPFEPDLQARLLQLYHASMDQRRVNGQPSGDSRTGRRLLSRLREAGLPVLAAGSSDWVLYPGEGGYTVEEQFFLETILNTIADSLAGSPQLDPADLQRWLSDRREQAAASRLVYIAHQLDILAQKPADG